MGSERGQDFAASPAAAVKRFLIIAAALAVAVPLTRLSSRMTVSSLEAKRTEIQAERLASAQTWIVADFEAIQADLLDRAQAVAADPDAKFLTGIEFLGSEPPEEVENAITRFQGNHAVDGPISLELYGTDLNIRAWSGASILPRPRSDSVRADLVVRLEQDSFRKALVLWMQVGQTGFVRAVRAIESAAVESSYLGYVDLEERWADETGLQLEVAFGPPTEGESDRVTIVPLYNVRSDVLGHAIIPNEAGPAVALEAEGRFANVEVFWWTLLLLWIAGGLWWGPQRLLMRAPTRGGRLVAATVFRIAILAGLRHAFLLLDVPGRWFRPGPAQDAFDPVFLASEVGFGIARSVGDLAFTGVFLLAAALVVLDAATRYRPSRPRQSTVDVLLGAFTAVSAIVAVVLSHAELTRQSMLDTTLDFFAWTGVSPEPLVLVVFAGLLLSTVGAIIVGVAVLVWFVRWTGIQNADSRRGLAIAGFVGLFAIAVVVANGAQPVSVPWWSLSLHLLAMLWPTYRYLTEHPSWLRSLRLRSLLITVLVSAVLLYPFLYSGMDEQRRARLLEVADSFSFRGDAQSVQAIEAVLDQLVADSTVTTLVESGTMPSNGRAQVQAAASRNSFVDLVPGIETARVEFFAGDGRSIGGYTQDRFETFGSIPSTIAHTSVEDVPGAADGRVETLRDARSNETTGFSAITEVRSRSSGGMVGWIAVRLDRQTVDSPLGSLFGYTDWRRTLSLAEFREGRRVRSEGEDFERYVLPVEIEERIPDETEVWRQEEVYSRAYVTYYRLVDSSPETVVAVRARAVIPYDHLYYLLRLAIAGLWLGIPAFLIGVAARVRKGLIPSRRRQYGDRVLDAFLVVGTLAVAGMGLVGQQVISRENEGAIRSRLERRLQRTEGALIRVAKPDEPLYAVQRRTPTDSLALQLGLDLAVYHGPWLDETSTPISQAGPLMGYRLPTQAYDELFIRRLRQAFVESSNAAGEVHTIGYMALVDEDGWPRSVIAVLTFPEQARIREERARTTAYFFGALLLLLLVIMATATTLARALTGPLRRLRDGMQSVAAGRVQRPIPVESRDEVGQLVETFNLMQDQLSESRRKLAQQERELAWSEMARQVAHEIKNPLTPMKLSIQHLKRAYEEFQTGSDDDRGRFAEVFNRITQTVAEQIDILANIANEFSTFARLPKRHVEVIDPNKIIREAVDLSAAELKSGIRFQETRTPVFVEADRDELRRVFINLLKNAVQSVEGEGTVEVVARITGGIGESAGKQRVLCEVRDNGPGIPPDVEPRIFQPNFSTKTSGMGLGLAIAKKSVESMGGEIGFRTEVGKGSTFWIELPLVDA